MKEQVNKWLVEQRGKGLLSAVQKRGLNLQYDLWWYFCPWEMVLIKFYPDSHLILISNFPMPQEQEQDSSLRFLEGILAKLLINEAQILCLKPSLPTPSALKERLAYYWEVLCLDWASINFFSMEYCQVCSIFLAASSVLSPYWDQGNGQAEHVAASCSG